MGDLEIVTTGDRHDLDEQARDAFRAGWPEFIFHDPISAEHIGRVETYFPQYDVLLLDEVRSLPRAGEFRSNGTELSAPCPNPARSRFAWLHLILAGSAS